MRFILCAFIFNSYGEEWWKSLIPFCSEYTKKRENFVENAIQKV